MTGSGHREMPLLHPDRLFPADASVRGIARRIFSEIGGLPILSPHGHTDPRWFAEDTPFPNPTELFLLPDHYILRMLYSQGIAMETLREGADAKNAQEVWRLFAAHYHLFRGTPTRLWLDYAFQELFGLDVRLSKETADLYWETISKKLATQEFRPRALYERFHMEVIATTDSALDDLEAHAAIRNSGWKGRVIPTFRPDAVVDPEFAGFRANLAKLGAADGREYIDAGRAIWPRSMARRQFFKQHGATATDHGHPTAATTNLSRSEAEALFRRVTRTDEPTPADAELFRAQMLTEMARMSVEDGLVMQLHVGSFRNYNPVLFAKWGRDQGADIPTPTELRVRRCIRCWRASAMNRLPADPVHAGRIDLQPGAGAAGRALSIGDSGAAVVVPRQPGGHAALPATRDRDCGLLQHGRLQRRHACIPFDSRTARCGATHGCCVPGDAGGGSPAGGGRGGGGGAGPGGAFGAAGLQAGVRQHPFDQFFACSTEAY